MNPNFHRPDPTAFHLREPPSHSQVSWVSEGGLAWKPVEMEVPGLGWIWVLGWIVPASSEQALREIELSVNGDTILHIGAHNLQPDLAGQVSCLTRQPYPISSTTEIHYPLALTPSAEAIFDVRSWLPAALCHALKLPNSAAAPSSHSEAPLTISLESQKSSITPITEREYDDETLDLSGYLHSDSYLRQKTRGFIDWLATKTGIPATWLEARYNFIVDSSSFFESVLKPAGQGLAPIHLLAPKPRRLWAAWPARNTVPPVAVALKCLPALNLSRVQAAAQLVTEATLINWGNQDLHNLNLHLRLGDFAESERVSLRQLVPWRLEPWPRLRLDFSQRLFRTVQSPRRVQLRAYANREEIPILTEASVAILPPNSWIRGAHEEALTAFAMPQDNTVERIVAYANRHHLPELCRWADSLDELSVSDRPEACQIALMALYHCLQERYGIHYRFEPFVPGDEYQLIRSHREVVENLAGTCIDLALLFAACLVNAHREPLIIVVASGGGVQHAIVGSWRIRTRFRRAVIRDASHIQNWISAGELLVLDPVGFTQNKKMRFSRAQSIGEKFLRTADMQFAVDVQSAYEDGVKPMVF